MAFSWPDDDAAAAPPLTPASRSTPHHNAGGISSHTHKPLAPPHLGGNVRFTPPFRRHTCPGFPYHTVASVYLGNLVITLFAIFALLTGLESLPNSSPARFRQVAVVIVAVLVGLYFLLHTATPLGALDGFIGAFGLTTVLCVLGAIPVVVFKEFREILHRTTQPWLISPHVLRVLHFLFLPLYDVGLVPLGFAGPTGWGGLFMGLTAPIVAFMFGAKKSFATGVATVWVAAGCLELLVVLAAEAAFIPAFIQAQEEHRVDTGYIWHSVLLVVHYTVPLLLILHGYSLWKLFMDRAPRPTVLWQEEDDAELANLYGPDSPGAQEGHVGILDAVDRGSSERKFEAGREDAITGSSLVGKENGAHAQ